MNKKFVVISFVFLLVLLFSPVVSATSSGAGSGTGGGGGAGPSLALWMDWCYPANGETNVSTTPVIQCKYSHNVAQGTVKDRNASLFSLQEKGGKEVQVVVYTADVQLEFDKRQYIYVRAVQPLRHQTTYVLTVKEGVQARNGMITAAEQSFEFTTCGAFSSFNDSAVESLVTDEQAVQTVDDNLATEEERPTFAESVNDGSQSQVMHEEAVQTVEVCADDNKGNPPDKTAVWLLLLLVTVVFAVSMAIKFWWRKRDK